MGLILRGGAPRTIPYTPTGGDLDAGDVVAGNSTGCASVVATCAMANNADGGSVAVGGGIYEGTMLSNYSLFTPVYYDSAADKLTTTSTNNLYFGFVTKVASAANTAGQAMHEPRISP